MSYPLVEMMMWQGLGDLINRFRTQVLHLEEVSRLWAPGQLYRLKVPYTYMWSPGLIPKPKDWGPEIDISGFVFLDLASSFTPSDELRAFLEGGEMPVYIGFGSIVVDDPEQFTKVRQSRRYPVCLFEPSPHPRSPSKKKTLFSFLALSYCPPYSI
jgi:hypothetical protein